MMRRLYERTVALATGKYSRPALCAVSFAESSFFPIPPDALLIPMIASDPRSAWKLAHICMVSSVLGGLLGYYIGYALFDSVGKWLIDIYGLSDEVDSFRQHYNTYGAWIILTKGLTPIPFKVVTIISGFAHFNLLTFFLASIVARSTRFYMLAYLLQRYGEPVRKFIEKRLGLAILILFLAIIGSFAALKFIPF